MHYRNLHHAFLFQFGVGFLSLIWPFLAGESGIASFFSLREISRILPYVMAVAAASFVYIAIADLVPILTGGSARGASFSRHCLLSPA